MENAEAVDLQSSADADAGLKETEPNVSQVAAQMEQAYKEAAAQSEEQAAEAYPGSVDQALQVDLGGTPKPSKQNFGLLVLAM